MKYDINTLYHIDSKMSVFLSPVKAKAMLSIGCVSPSIQRSFAAQSHIYMPLEVKNSFILELAEAKLKCDDLSYIDTVNSQLSGYQLKEGDRLENRFHSLSSKLKSNFVNSKGRKNQSFWKSLFLLAYMKVNW